MYWKLEKVFKEFTTVKTTASITNISKMSQNSGSMRGILFCIYNIFHIKLETILSECNIRDSLMVTIGCFIMRQWASFILLRTLQ